MTCRERELAAAELVCERIRTNASSIVAILATSHNPTVRALATGTHAEEAMSAFELVALLSFILGATSQTTNVLMAQLATTLAEPTIWRRVTEAAEPDALVDRIVFESLRLASPIQTVGRMPFDGSSAQFLNLAAANRDPSIYTNPHTVSCDESRRPHVAFGHGEHYCVGAATARDMAGLFVRAIVTHGRRPVVVAPGRASFRYFLRAMKSHVIGFEQ